MRIIELVTKRTAFTSDTLPGFDKKSPANDEQVTAHVDVMNRKAESLGITTRYEAVA